MPTIPVAPNMRRAYCLKCACTCVSVAYNADANALVITCHNCTAVGACEAADAPREPGGKSTRTIELPEVDDDQGDDDDGEDA